MENEKKNYSEEELIRRVEKAAHKGATAGGRNGKILLSVIMAVVIVIGVLTVSQYVKSFSFFATESDVSGHDLTLENHGFFGYTVADFAEAILGDAKQLKKLEVYTAEISDVATISDTGLANLKLFTKTQLITYHGQATYTVDLSKLSAKDIKVDESSMTVTLQIPHAKREEINILADQIEFGDIERGLLAMGKLKLTPEQTAKVETEAKKKMEEKLEQEKIIETADRFAKLSVWELYQPLVVAVSPAYQLEVEFK